MARKTQKEVFRTLQGQRSTILFDDDERNVRGPNGQTIIQYVPVPRVTLTPEGYATSNPDEIERLKNHPDYGVRFVSQGDMTDSHEAALAHEQERDAVDQAEPPVLRAIDGFRTVKQAIGYLVKQFDGNPTDLETGGIEAVHAYAHKVGVSFPDLEEGDGPAKATRKQQDQPPPEVKVLDGFHTVKQAIGYLVQHHNGNKGDLEAGGLPAVQEYGAKVGVSFPSLEEEE